MKKCVSALCLIIIFCLCACGKEIETIANDNVVTEDETKTTPLAENIGEEEANVPEANDEQEKYVAPDWSKSFEYDGRHIVFNGYAFVLGETKLKDIPDDFFVFSYDLGKRELAAEDDFGKYTNQIAFYPNYKDGDNIFDTPACRFAFSEDVQYLEFAKKYIDGECSEEEYENATEPAYIGDKVLNDLALWHIWVPADTTELPLADLGYAFDFGSGLTETSKYSDFCAILGEPDFTHFWDSERAANTVDYTEYAWDRLDSDFLYIHMIFDNDGNLLEFRMKYGHE